MSFASTAVNMGKSVLPALLGAPGVAISKSQNKAADAKAQTGPQQAGNKGNSVGNTILKALLGPVGGLLLGK